jgi:intracellular septation protein A
MDINTFFVGVLPILIFVILDSVTTKKAAILSAMLLALGELIFTLVKYHTIDELTVLSVVLVALFGGLSIKKNNDVYFKLQPAILGFFFAASFFFFYYFLDKPIFNFMIEKYFNNDVEPFLHNRVPKGYFLELMRVLSRDLGWWILAHALLTAYAAFRMSKWWWFAIRVPFFYVIIFIAMWVEQRVVMH